MSLKYRLEDFIKYKDLLFKGTPEERYDIINKIRKASSIEENPPLDLIIQAGIVPVLMNYHKNNDLPESVLQDILWALANIGSGDAEETLYIVQQGGIEHFMEFSGYFAENVYGQALWGLANIAGESAKFRDLLLSKGVAAKTMEVYYKRRGGMKVETRRTVAWVVNNLCRNKPPVDFHKVEECLPYLVDSLKDQDHDVIVENLWTCAYMTEISDEAIRAIVNKRIMNQVVSHLNANIDRLTIVTPALKACSNVVSGADDVTEKLLNLNIIPSVISLLGSQKPIIRREACYFFSNVAAGLPAHINLMFENQNFLPAIITILKNDEAGVLNEAIWIISNSLMGNTQNHARKIINNDVFIPILKRLNLVSKRTQLMALEGFRELLNHAMDMYDTPVPLLSQIKFYKENIERTFLQLKDTNFSKTLSDIKNLISDILDNSTPDEKNLANSRLVS